MKAGRGRSAAPTTRPPVSPQDEELHLAPGRFIGSTVHAETAPLNHRSRRLTLRDGTRRQEHRLFIDLKLEVGWFEDAEAVNSFDRYMREHEALPIVKFSCAFFTRPHSPALLPLLRSAKLAKLLTLLTPAERGRVMAGTPGWPRLFLGRRLLVKLKVVVKDPDGDETPTQAHYCWAEKVLREVPLPRAPAYPSPEGGSTCEPPDSSTLLAEKAGGWSVVAGRRSQVGRRSEGRGNGSQVSAAGRGVAPSSASQQPTSRVGAPVYSAGVPPSTPTPEQIKAVFGVEAVVRADVCPACGWWMFCRAADEESSGLCVVCPSSLP